MVSEFTVEDKKFYRRRMDMNIKKTIITAIAVTLLLGGCAKNEEAAEQPVTDTSEIEATDASIAESTAMMK